MSVDIYIQMLDVGGIWNPCSSDAPLPNAHGSFSRNASLIKLKCRSRVCLGIIDCRNKRPSDTISRCRLYDSRAAIHNVKMTRETGTYLGTTFSLPFLYTGIENNYCCYVVKNTPEEVFIDNNKKVVFCIV